MLLFEYSGPKLPEIRAGLSDYTEVFCHLYSRQLAAKYLISVAMALIVVSFCSVSILDR